MCLYKLIEMLTFEIDKPSIILIKILSAAEYIESDIQNAKARRINDRTI